MARKAGRAELASTNGGERNERLGMELCERASIISPGWSFLACNTLAKDGKQWLANKGIQDPEARFKQGN